MEMGNKNLTTKQWVSLLRSVAEGAPPIVRTRGVVKAPSVETRLEQVISQLVRQPREVRREVIAALGEEPDALAAIVLSKLVRYEPDWRLRQEIIAALTRADDQVVVNTLMHLAERDPIEDIQISAIRALGKVALDAYPELTVRRRGIRVRGTVRVRGVAPSRRVSPEAEAILALLDEIRHQDLSERVRDAADEILGELDE